MLHRDVFGQMVMDIVFAEAHFPAAGMAVLAEAADAVAETPDRCCSSGCWRPMGSGARRFSRYTHPPDGRIPPQVRPQSTAVLAQR